MPRRARAFTAESFEFEGRLLLAAYVGFNDAPVQVVNDQVGTVQANVALNIDNPSDTTPGEPQGQPESIAITHGTDTTNPTVVQSQALVQAGYVVAFSIQFSKPMAIGPVTNLANYAVAAPDRPVGEVLITTSFSKNIPLKSVTYDATSDTAYLVPMTKLKILYTRLYGGIGSSVSGEFHNYYQIESPAILAAAIQAKQASSGTSSALNQSLSTLTDTLGNPIFTTGGNGLNDLGGEGRLFTQPQLAKARPTDLVYIFGARTHAERKRGRS